MAKKSLFLTYLLWLFGGFFGLHHFYLRRDRHALVWGMFAGGYFGIGWIRDIWRIPEYVKDANEDEHYMVLLANKMKKYDKPPSSTVRYCGQILVADAFGYLVIGALPQELISETFLPFAAVVVPLAVATGVHIIGNIGREKGDFIWPLLGAYLTYPLYLWNMNSVFWTSLVSSIFFNSFSKQWRRTPSPVQPLWYRMFIVLLCGALYVTLWSSFLYFNCTVSSQDGEEVKCRDAAKHFFTSPMWKEFKSVISDVYQFAKYHGWKEVWHHIVQAFDPYGETNALNVLELDSSASQEEITARYRKLSRQWHPDKHKDLDKKQEAQEKFIEIQRAYEVLSKIKSKRVTQNTKVSDDASKKYEY